MHTRNWIPLCALAALLAACGGRDDPAERAAAESVDESIETVPDNPVAPGDQTSTPGGTAGETAVAPPGTQPDTTTPPDTTTSPDTNSPGG